MIEHDEETQRVLRHAGLSANSELTPEEEARIPAAAEALQSNPSVARPTLYRILRPKQEDQDE